MCRVLGLDGRFLYEERVGDLGVREPVGDQLEHFALGRGRTIPSPRTEPCRPFCLRSAAQVVLQERLQAHCCLAQVNAHSHERTWMKALVYRSNARQLSR